MPTPLPPDNKSDLETLIGPEPHPGIPMPVWVIGIALLSLLFGWLLV